MKKRLLTATEKEILGKYRATFEKSYDDQLITPISQLFDYEQLKEYMGKVQEWIKAPNKMVAASMFSKRYSFLIVVPALYAIGVLNKKLNYSVDNLNLKTMNSGEVWLPEIQFLDDQVEHFEDGDDRNECLEKIVQTLFADHLTILWDHLSDIGGISKQTLWENTAIYVFWMYESLLKEENISTQIKNQLIDDFHFVLLKAQGDLFGNYKRNPLVRFYNEYTIRGEEKIRVRKTCCFSYEISDDGTMCKTCPKNC